MRTTVFRMETAKLAGRAAVLFALAGLASSHAAELEWGKPVEKVALSGDLRVRQENIVKSAPGQADRGRQRFRLRLGADLSLPREFSVGFRLASGTGEAVSANQSFDNFSSQKQIWIDRAFLEWKPLPEVRLAGGRMANPLWTVYSSDVVWDEEFNPEGFGQRVTHRVGAWTWFANSLQMAVDEDAGSQEDPWVFAGQAGAEAPLPGGSRLRAAAALYEWVNESARTRVPAADFGQTARNEGNRRVFFSSGALLNEFQVAELTGEWSAAAFGVPVAVQGTYAQNRRSRLWRREDTGYQVGAILGKAKARNTGELAYFYKSVETDATVADMADSDFGDGGTNRRGSILWAAYNPEEWLQVKIKYSATRVLNSALPPGPDDVDRLQADVFVRF
jgi:hypothetical protein